MKKETPILQMYYGERGAHEKIQQSPKYWELLKRAISEDDVFRACLQEEQNFLDLYEKVLKGLSEAQCEEVAETYREGFRFGFLMALDVMGIFS